MVSWSSVVFSGISALLALGVPVIAAIWFWRRTRVPFSTILIGALTFFVMQILLRVPLLQVANFFLSFDTDTTSGLLIYSGFLAVTAALFEELGRLIFFKLFRRQGDWKNAVALGIGHGGIESVILTGITVAANTIVLAILAMDIPLDLPAQTLNELTSIAPSTFLLGGIERILVLPVHVAFSILVVVGATRKQWRFIGLAIIGHTLLNFPLIWMISNWNAWTIEAYVLIWSIGAWFFILRSKRLFPAPPALSA